MITPKGFLSNNCFYTIIGLIIITGISAGYMSRSCFTKAYHTPRIVKMCYGHFTGPLESDKIVLIEPVRDEIDSNFIEIYNLKGSTWKKLWESPPAPVWDIFLSDVDGDRCDELALCLYKTEPHDPRKDNRLQIYSWHNGHIYARWRGTFLSKPFEIISFGDVTGNSSEELISIERGRIHSERIFLCVYRWNSFGFDFITETELSLMPGAMSVTNNNNNSLNTIVLNYDSHDFEYKFHNDSLIQSEAVK